MLKQSHIGDVVRIVHKDGSKLGLVVGYGDCGEYENSCPNGVVYTIPSQKGVCVEYALEDCTKVGRVPEALSMEEALRMVDTDKGEEVLRTWSCSDGIGMGTIVQFGWKGVYNLGIVYDIDERDYWVWTNASVGMAFHRKFQNNLLVPVAQTTTEEQEAIVQAIKEGFSTIALWNHAYPKDKINVGSIVEYEPTDGITKTRLGLVTSISDTLETYVILSALADELFVPVNQIKLFSKIKDVLPTDQAKVIQAIKEGNGAEALWNHAYPKDKINVGSIVQYESKKGTTHLGLVTSINGPLGGPSNFFVIRAKYADQVWLPIDQTHLLSKVRDVLPHVQNEILWAMKRGGGPKALQKYAYPSVKEANTEPFGSQKTQKSHFGDLHPSEIKWNSIESTKSRGFPVWDGVPEPVVSKSFKEPLKEIDPKDCCTGSDIGNVK